MDRPIHLSSFSIAKKDSGGFSVTVPLWITQSTLDGMIELLKFLEGVTVTGNIGTVPGAFDVLMFYRTIRDTIYKAEDEAVQSAAFDPPPDGEPADYNPHYCGSGVDRFGRKVLTIDEIMERLSEND